VGMLKQRCSIGFHAVEAGGDADADAELQRLAGDAARLGDLAQYLLRHHRAVARLLDALDQKRELVAAEPRRRVVRAQALLQLLAHILQHFIARGMAERVVDLLEAVEIEEKYAKPEARPPDARQRDIEAALEQRAVGKPGQRIEIGLGDER